MKSKALGISALVAALVLFVGARPGRCGAMDEVMFSPGWSGLISVDGSSQGHGQTTGGSSFSATYQFRETGTSMSLGFNSGSQKVEGLRVAYGGLSFSGCAAADLVSLSLTLSASRSGMDMSVRSASLGLDWEASEKSTFSLGGGLSAQRHVGPLSYLLDIPDTNLTSLEAEMLSHSLGLDLGFHHALGYRFGFSLGAAREWNTTDEVRNRSGTSGRKMDRKGWTNSFMLGTDWNLGKGFGMNIGGSWGRQYSPGQGFYNPRTGATDVFTGAQSVDFFGTQWSLSYSFGF